MTESGSNPTSNSKAWQLATIIIPVVLTAWLTYFFSRSQTRITQEIDAKNQVLSAQLNLATELYKRRFDAYETLYTHLIDMNDKLLLQQANAMASRGANASRDKQQAAINRQTADLIAELNNLNEQNSLHMSKEVSTLMAAAWQAGAQGDTAELAKKITEVEAQMKTELQAEMETNAPPAASHAGAQAPAK